MNFKLQGKIFGIVLYFRPPFINGRPQDSDSVFGKKNEANEKNRGKFLKNRGFGFQKTETEF